MHGLKWKVFNRFNISVSHVNKCIISTEWMCCSEQIIPLFPLVFFTSSAELKWAHTQTNHILANLGHLENMIWKKRKEKKEMGNQWKSDYSCVLDFYIFFFFLKRDPGSRDRGWSNHQEAPDSGEHMKIAVLVLPTSLFTLLVSCTDGIHSLYTSEKYVATLKIKNKSYKHVCLLNTYLVKFHKTEI